MKAIATREAGRKGLRAISVKRAISLPADIDRKVKELVVEKKRPYSAVVVQALRGFLKAIEKQRLETAYKSYYKDQASLVRDEARAEDSWELSQEGWPE